MTTANGKAEDEELLQLFNSVVLTRAQLARSLMPTRRDIDAECDYPLRFDARVYQALYDEEPIPRRAVELYPKECWKTSPEVWEDPDESVETPFEASLKTVSQGLFGERSRYRDLVGNPLWHYLARADVKQGIGSYGVVYFGIDDGKAPSAPAEMLRGSTVTRKLRYVRVYSETEAQVLSSVSDKNDPRYGQPEMYGVQFPEGSISVHWTRCVHLSEEDIYHTPRLQALARRGFDLRKLYAGSAEMYWQAALPGIVFKTIPQLGSSVKVDRGNIEQQMEKYSNTLQKFLVLLGMEASTLAPNVSDPGTQIDKQIEAICIALDCPVRVFKGAERGQLASEQDDDDWNGRLEHRRDFTITPRIVVPSVDRLIDLGCLVEPQEFHVGWQPLSSKDRVRTMTEAKLMAETLEKQAASGLSLVDYLVKVVGWTQPEAEAAATNGARSVQPADSGAADNSGE